MKLTFIQLLALLGVAVIVVAAALILLLPRGACADCAFDSTPVSSQVMSDLQVSANSPIGAGAAINKPQKISAQPLTMGNKTVIFYYGAEFCPYCAVERWGLVVALLRFGSFSGLRYMTSSPTDIAASTPTFTFYNSTYTSNYIVFESVEAAGNKFVNGTYPKLQSLNSQQQAIVQKLDTSGDIPFLDIGNRTIQIGASYSDPTIFDSKNWTQIALQLSNSSSLYAQVVVGSANLLTAEICIANANVPQSVCGTTAIQNLEKTLS